MPVLNCIPWTFGVFLLVLLFSACEDPERAEERRKLAAQALNRREIKRVTEDQLRELAVEEGAEIARVMQKDLNRTVNKQLEEASLSSIDEFYKITNLNARDTLEKNYEANIRMLSFAHPEAINPVPSSQENALLKDYQEGNIPMQPRADILSEQEILFTSPIILEAQPQGIWSITFTRKYLVYKMNVKAFH